MPVRKLLLLPAVLIVSAFGVYGFGTNLPETHIVTRKAVYHQPREKVWAAVSDYEHAADWSEAVARVERRPDVEGKPVWRMYDEQGKFMDIQVAEQEAPVRQQSRVIASDYPFDGSWTFELEEADGRTLVTLTEEGRIGSPVWRLILRYLMGEDRTVRAYLQELGDKFGESPHIVG